MKKDVWDSEIFMGKCLLLVNSRIVEDLKRFTWILIEVPEGGESPFLVLDVGGAKTATVIVGGGGSSSSKHLFTSKGRDI
ncbi:MAG: hypothetical protein KAJ58_01470 [Candidatus Pacebacteria bacterium]|nr:hypothetical protein [Candidatus Paceibacterota bacterium]